MRIFLTGFMGAGKTTVGEHLARDLGVPFVDLDRRVEELAGLRVGEIFDRHGESLFRRLERRALLETGELERAVVATGGGTITFETNRAWMAAHGISVWLHPGYDTLVSRLRGLPPGERPLFRDEAQAQDLYRQRLAAYRLADLRVEIRPAEGPAEVAARVGLLLRERDCVI